MQFSIQAESNVQKIIVSNPTIGADAYGLTDIGMEQAKQVLTVLVEIVCRGHFYS